MPQPKGIHRVTKRRSSGAEVKYHYAWRGGPRFWTSTSRIPENGPAYWQAYMKAVEELAPAAGTFRQVLLDYLASPEFASLKPRSRRDIEVSIGHPENGIDARFGDAPLEAFNRDQIRTVIYQWRDKIASDRVADMRVTHLSGILSWALDRRLIRTHHARSIRKRYNASRSDVIWTDAEIETFIAGAPSWIGNALLVATETGLRPGDLIRLTRAHIDKDSIRMRTGKRDRMVVVPITRKLRAYLDTIPSDQFLLVPGAQGGPLADPNYLGRKVGQWRDRLGLRPELHFYDARGTAATRLYQADASLRQIATAMGWSPQHTAAMIEVYAAENPDAPSDLLDRLARG